MKSHLLNLGAVLLIATIAFVVYGFWYSAIAEESATVASLHEQITAKTEAVDNIASARAALTEITSDQDIIQHYFVPETGIVAFIDKLETQGKSLGATVNVLSVSAGSPGAHPTFALSLSIGGTFDSVMRTVGAIEYAPYDLSVSNFSLSQGEEKIWNASLNLVVGSIKTTTTTTIKATATTTATSTSL